jgi:tetratricopeptide (TPR) repeat protein
MSDTARAEAYWKEALARARELQKQYPGNQDAETLLAYALFDISSLTRDSRSLGYRIEALPIDEALLKAKPSDPRRQRDVALINKSIAGYWLAFDANRALPYLERALAMDEQRFAKDPGDQGIQLDLSFDYSQFGQYYAEKNDLPTAIRYQRKTLAIRRDLAASDPHDVWKQERLAWTLTSIASLRINTRDYHGALADLDESKSILDHPGLSSLGTMTVYAFWMTTAGEASRAIGNEPAACAQFLKARDLYDKAGFSLSSL